MELENIKILTRINPWWSDACFRFMVIERPDYVKAIDLSSKHIDILLGARRVGKTSIMETKINQLLEQGVFPDNILLISADDPFLINLDLANVLREFIDQSSQKTYVFIDEIQDITGWHKVLKYFYDHDNVKFVVSGSSSLLINQEARKLTGRMFVHEIWTLGWIEAKMFNSSITFKQYMQHGGYPEVVLQPQLSIKLVQSIIESTLYRDLLGLYGIQNPKVLLDLLRLLSEKVGNPVSFRSIAKQLSIDDGTAKKFIEYLLGIRLIIELPLKTVSTKKALRNPSKYYIADNGIITNLALHVAEGGLAENLVALQLQASKSAETYGYLIDENGQEIDFVFGVDKYEVKYREDWKELLVDNETAMTVITKTTEDVVDAYIIVIGLEDFLTKNVSGKTKELK